MRTPLELSGKTNIQVEEWAKAKHHVRDCQTITSSLAQYWGILLSLSAGFFNKCRTESKWIQAKMEASSKQDQNDYHHQSKCLWSRGI